LFSQPSIALADTQLVITKDDGKKAIEETSAR
jgi:hypothetical protein